MKENSLKSKAAALVSQLEQERAGRTLMLGQVVKTQNTTPIILNAEPELQVAFVECVVQTYAKLGTPKGKKIREWFRAKAVPNASAEIVRLLLRRQLPFTDAALAGMLESLSRISFLSLVEFREHLAMAVEKLAKKNGMSARLRKAAARYADVLAVRHLPPAQAHFWKDEWGFPTAQDRRVAARLDRVLGR